MGEAGRAAAAGGRGYEMEAIAAVVNGGGAAKVASWGLCWAGGPIPISLTRQRRGSDGLARGTDALAYVVYIVFLRPSRHDPINLVRNPLELIIRHGRSAGECEPLVEECFRRAIKGSGEPVPNRLHVHGLPHRPCLDVCGVQSRT